MLAAGLLVMLGACGSGSHSASRSTTTIPVTSTTTTARGATATTRTSPAASATTYPVPSTTVSTQDELMADLTKQTIIQGLTPSSFVISATISTSNRSWAEFGVSPSTSVAPDTFQSYRGFAHLEEGAWVITTYGTAGLNCSALPGQPYVPSAVLQEFGWALNPNCPGSSS